MRHGIGHALLAELVERCTKLGYRQMVAVIGDSANLASIRLHEKLGFARIGVLPAVGFKHGRWVDSVLMQHALGQGTNSLPAVKPPQAASA
jgi:phosphinothricin acetyltransferase